MKDDGVEHFPEGVNEEEKEVRKRTKKWGENGGIITDQVHADAK